MYYWLTGRPDGGWPVRPVTGSGETTGPGTGSGRLLPRGGAPGDVAGDDRRVDVLEHGLARDHDALHVLATRHLVHDRLQDLFEDRAQPAGAGAAQVGLVGDGLERVGGELQVHAVQLEQPP